MADLVADTSEWPLVIVRWPPGEVSDASIEAFLKESLEHLRRPDRHVVMHLAKGLPQVTSTQRKRLAEHTNSVKDQLQRKVGAAAIVVESTLARGLVTAINWMAPPPFEQKIFAAENDARKWLLEKWNAARESDRSSHVSPPRA